MVSNSAAWLKFSTQESLARSARSRVAPWTDTPPGGSNGHQHLPFLEEYSIPTNQRERTLTAARPPGGAWITPNRRSPPYFEGERATVQGSCRVRTGHAPRRTFSSLIASHWEHWKTYGTMEMTPNSGEPCPRRQLPAGSSQGLARLPTYCPHMLLSVGPTNRKIAHNNSDRGGREVAPNRQ